MMEVGEKSKEMNENRAFDSIFQQTETLHNLHSVNMGCHHFVKKLSPPPSGFNQSFAILCSQHDSGRDGQYRWHLRQSGTSLTCSPTRLKKQMWFSNWVFRNGPYRKRSPISRNDCMSRFVSIIDQYISVSWRESEFWNALFGESL